MVDGWEMGGEFFPSVEDHARPLEERVVSDCGSRQMKKVFQSSQNAALIQYLVSDYGQGFSIRVRSVKNAKRKPFLFPSVSYTCIQLLSVVVVVVVVVITLTMISF